MYETVKEYDKETINKESIAPLTRENTNSLQASNVDYIGEINNSLVI